MQYRAFISYSHVDRKWARWLHRKLEAYRLPGNFASASGKALPKRLSPIFRDRDELPSTSSLSDAVNHALRESEWLIIICSPDASASRWVNEEIRAFRRLGRSDRILCFIVGGEPFSGDQNECFPKALTELDMASGAGVEPVAADARPQGDGRTNALLKIIAGLLGVGLDALKHREQSRRNQRLIVATAASLLIAALTIALAVAATLARNEADLRRGQAENLIDFMLGDLQDQLRGIGRLDLYQSIGDKSLEYFAALGDENVSDYSLSQRAKNLRQIGEVRMEQGKLSAALVAFEQSQQIMTRLAARDRSNVENQIGLANSYYYVGAVYWQRGGLQEARRQFERVVPIVDAVSKSDPDNTNWLLERGYGHTNLGRVLELEGALDEALVSYHTVMSINQRLVELEPDNPEWTLELGFAYNNIGKLATTLGRLDEAQDNYRQDLALKTFVLESNPQNNIRRSYVAASQFYLGQLLTSMGKYEEAETQLLSALQILEDLTRLDPEQIAWQGRLANTKRELGKLLVYTGRTDPGLKFIQSSISILNRLSIEDEYNASFRRELVRGLTLLAKVEFSLGEADSAGEHLALANLEIETLLQEEPSSRDTQVLAAHADVCVAMVTAERNPDSAKQSYAQALQRVEEKFSDSSDPNVLELKAIALAGLSQPARAAEINDRLQKMGFVLNCKVSAGACL